MNTSTTEVSQEFDSSVDETVIEVSENTAISSDGPAQSSNDAVDPSEANEDDELVISLDGQELTQDNEDHKQAPAWVKELRKASREKDKRIRELESKLNVSSATHPEVKLPPKPRLEDLDFDSDKYEEKLSEWFELKRKYDVELETTKKAQEEAENAWKERLTIYNKSKNELRVRDYDDAESFVQEQFSTTQQGIILQGLDNPALVVYALGKNHKKAGELANIKDPVKFAVAVGKLETQLKITSRKSPPPPSRVVSGTARVSGSMDSTLERLRVEAEKTGDYTKVVRYKAQKKSHDN